VHKYGLALLCLEENVHPLEANGKGTKGQQGMAGKEAYTVHIVNIISQLQYFVATCLTSYVETVCLLFTF
jgi:hypothetical protein